LPPYGIVNDYLLSLSALLLGLVGNPIPRRRERMELP
jgi:hypothetical protein